MKKITLGKRCGYNHSRYDSFDCDMALLIAAGGNETADCFASCDCEHDCDCDGIKSIESWFNDGVTPKDFNETVLDNLSRSDFSDFSDFKNDPDETEFKIILCAGTGNYTYLFNKIDGKIICACDGGEQFEII